jgi:hypothetical protein
MPSDIKAVNTECNQWVTAAQCERQKKTGCMFDVPKGAACGAMNSRDASEIVGNWCDEDGQCLLTPDDIAAMARFNQTPLATRLAKITTEPPLDIALRATAITPQSLAANWPALEQQARASNRIEDVREDTAAGPFLLADFSLSMQLWLPQQQSFPRWSECTAALTKTKAISHFIGEYKCSAQNGAAWKHIDAEQSLNAGEDVPLPKPRRSTNEETQMTPVAMPILVPRCPTMECTFCGQCLTSGMLVFSH